MRPRVGRVEHQTLAIAAGRAHLDHVGAALGHLLDDDARIFLVHVDDDFLDGLEQFAGRLVLGEHHAGTRHGELEAFAAHGLDQDRELQFAAAGDEERILVGRLLDLQRDVAFAFLEEAVADHAARDLVALGAGERAESLTRNDMVTVGGSIGWAWIGMSFSGAQKVSATEPFTRPAMDDDVAGLAEFDRLALEAAEREDLRHPAGLDQLAFAVDDLDGLVRLHRAGAKCGP